MAAYNYTAYDARGRIQRGEVDVDTQTQAIRFLKDMGLYPTRILPAPTPASKSIGPLTGTSNRKPWRFRTIWPRGRRIGRKKLTVFTRQLATLLEAGLPVVKALSLLERQETQAGFKQVLQRLQTAIEGGGTLSEALSQHRRLFNSFYLSMVRAGEAAGVLEMVLHRLAEFMEKAQKIRAKVASTLVYPCAVMVVALFFLAVMMTCLIPRFEGIFRDLLGTSEMPAFTQLVINVSHFLKNHFLWVLAGLGVTWGLFKVARMTAAGRVWGDRIRLRLPVFGALISKIAIARLARSLGTLLKSGVPILQALTTVREIAGNAVFAAAVNTIHERVKQGDTITQPLETTGIFPPTLVGMIDVGEQTGALPDMLLKTAEICDDEADNLVSALTSLLEPVMIVFIALVVGSLIIALFMPLLTLMRGVDGQGLGSG
jgi:type IV pilus assembly protein PilC